MHSNQNKITSILNFPQQIKSNELKLEEIKLNSFISIDSTNDPNMNIKMHKYIFENDKKSYDISIILFKEKSYKWRNRLLLWNRFFSRGIKNGK